MGRPNSKRNNAPELTNRAQAFGATNGLMAYFWNLEERNQSSLKESEVVD